MPDAAFTTAGVVALCVAGLAAIANWVAVSTGRRKVEWITKPAVMVALIVVALVADPIDGAVRAWVIVGLVFSLAGDVFLMLPTERFVSGLASFFVAHVAYIVAFALRADSATGAVIGVVVAAASLAVIGRPIVAAVRRDQPALVGPVIAYMAVISAMVVVGFADATTWVVAGAVFFFASDGILATNKFARRVPGARFAIMSTYHAAQFCFVVALVR